ncbi:hypothetical protein VOM14_23095 [Paraburkholderia sp. MPAMCS5]|uniref:hypothetical protein n=1 Tax=Paraburkholderia sp. MPAMCS5 TaxID=3112563 RepID=UPI002E193B2A|nr:hypothetical protein [Paraburkholderia sp. MPAMCS5]
MLDKDGFSEIYEYKNRYWVIQKSHQMWPKGGGPTERVALAGDLPCDCSDTEMGSLCISALDNFNSIKPPFSPWQTKELRQLFCSWVGAKGWASFYKNSRYIWIKYDKTTRYINVIPVDNCRISPVESAIEEKIESISWEAGTGKIGQAIFAAFRHSTSHPERKT